MDFPWGGLALILFGWWIYREAKKDGLATWKAVALAIGGAWLFGTVVVFLVLWLARCTSTSSFLYRARLFTPSPSVSISPKELAETKANRQRTAKTETN